MTPRILAWQRQALSDLDAARLTAAAGLHAQACYLAGPAAEKALKALLLASGQPPHYSHSLPRLIDELQQVGIDTTPLEGLPLRQVSRMETESRYPQGDEAPSDRFDSRDSTTALSTAEATLRFVGDQLNPAASRD
ncbi:MAG: HEPN domain-containing protein [Cyanobium sp.]